MLPLNYNIIHLIVITFTIALEHVAASKYTEINITSAIITLKESISVSIYIYT